MAADAFERGEHPGADFSRAFSDLTLVFVAREVRAAGAGAKRAAR
jgi:hypothetical protein